MSMSRYGLEVVVDKMVNSLGAEALLNELISAMSTDELEENLEFVDRMNDLGLFVDDDEEDEYFVCNDN